MRFKLRNFLLVATMVSVVFGFVVSRANTQLKVVQRIGRRGVIVSFDDTGSPFEPDGWRHFPSSGSLTWNCFHKATSVWIHSDVVLDEELRDDLRCLPRLKSIYVYRLRWRSDLEKVQKWHPNATVYDLYAIQEEILGGGGKQVEAKRIMKE